MKQIFKNQFNFAYKKIEVTITAVVLVLTYATFMVSSGAIPIADATVPLVINFQGKLTKVSDGTNVSNGTYAFRFKLYDASTSGTLLWTETYDQAPTDPCQKVQVTNGVFNVKLGSCASLAGVDFSGGSVYLSVDYAPTGTSYDGEMSPRKQLLSSAFAILSNGVSGNGGVRNTLSSSTALAIAKAGTDYALQVDTSAGSAVTGLKVTSAAAASGLALTTLSTGTNENLTLDAKGSGTLSINGSATGDVLFGGGSGSTGCTVTNSTGAFACSAAISSGVAGSTIGGYNLSGNTSGTISILPQAAAGTYNFNLPTTAGTSGYVLTSAGGGASAMTWTDPSGLGVRWNALQAPTGSLSLAHGANTTAFSFDSVTSANAFSLTSSSLSSGSILNIAATGTAGLTNQKGINVSLSGANGTGAQTTYGGYFSNTHTGTSNNVGLYATATGGSNNYAAIFENGNVGIGTTAPVGALTINGPTPAVVGSGSGTNAISTLALTGGAGGDTNDTSFASGGVGSNSYITSGNGGAVPGILSGGLGTGGTGGFIALTAGSGGSAAAAGGGTARGGLGSNVTISAGAGGVASGAGTLTQGGGGYVELKGGNAASGSGTLKDGGSIFLSGGTSAGTGSNAGNIILARTQAGTNQGLVGIRTATPTAVLDIGNGALSSASWTTGGIQLQAEAATYTDTSGSGTIANRVGSSFAQPTFASSSAVTVTDASTLYIANAPAAGTNTTLTRAHALQVAAGDAVFAGNVGIGNTAPASLLSVGSTSQFQVNSSGAIAAATGISSSGTIAFSGLSTNGAVYTSGGTGTLTTTAPTSGAIGYWQRTGTVLSQTTTNDTISIPTSNTTGADLALTNTGVYTGTGIFNLTADSATTGTLASVTGNALTTGSLLSLSSSSTGALTGQKGLNVALTGALTGAQTTYGGYFSNTRSGASAVNVGAYFTASGATGANYAAIFNGGNVGIGTTTPSNLLSIYGSTGGGAIGIDVQNAASNGYVQLNVINDASHIGAIGVGGTATADIWQNRVYIESQSGLDGIILNTEGSGQDIKFYTGNDAFAGIISSTGNYGIGTAFPIEALHVSGNTRFDGSAPATATLLNGAINNVVTTITVDSTASYPASGTLQIENELMTYTGKTGTTFTGITRGSFGTTAASHVDNMDVYNQIFNVFAQANTNSSFTVMGNGTVGIGTSTPNINFSLEVDGNTLHYGEVSADRFRPGINNTNGEINSYGGISQPLVLQSHGGVTGIGANTPGAFLDIQSPNASSITAEQIQVRSSATTQTLTDGTTIANWRNNQFIAPTLNGVAGGGTETVTNAATLYIDTAPSGSNITITNPYALWVGGGNTRLDGNLSITSTNTTQTTTASALALNANSLTSGTGQYVSSTSVTSGVLASLNQSTSAFTGTGLKMNFANASGSFSGNFADFQSNSVSKFSVSSTGAITSATLATGGASQCLQANTSGVISITGSACGSGGGLTVGTTAIASGTAGRVLFEGSGNVLQEAGGLTWDNTDASLVLTTASTTASNKALSVSQTGATTGTDYAGYFSNTGAATTNVAGYFSATGATNNYAAIFENGNVGIGDTAPSAALSLIRSGSDSSYRSRTYSNTNWQGNYIVGDRAEGTSGTPLAVTTGDHLIGVTANAYASGAFNFAGSFTFYVEGAPSGANVPTYFTLWTTSTSGSAERLHVKSTGEIGVGTSGPDRQFEINSATGSNLRLTYNDSDGSAANYADLLMSASGDLTIAPSGSDTNITGNLTVASGDITATTGNVAITAGALTLGGTTRISNAGVGSFITGTTIGSQTFTTNNIADSGALTIASGTASALTLNSGTTGTISIGSDTSAESILIGTGVAAKTITIGNSTDDTLSINSSAFNVSTGGIISGATGLTSSGTIAFSGLSTNGAVYTSGGTGTLTTTAPTSGAIGYWQRTGTKLTPTTSNDIAEIANTTTTGADLALTNTGVYTGTGIFNLTANSATTGTLASFSGTALTTGKLIDIAAGTALTTGTAINVSGASYNPGGGNTGSLINLAFTNAATNAASDTSTVNGINIASIINSSGATGTHVTTGINIAAVTGTPTTGSNYNYGIHIGNQGLSGLSTSYGLLIDAQSGSTNNYGAYINGTTSIIADGIAPYQPTVQISKSTAVTTYQKSDAYIFLGLTESAANSTRLIGFGYGAGSTNLPAYMGYLTTSTASQEKGALVFGTRDVTTDTAATERMRIGTNGNVGIGTTGANALLSVAGNVIVGSGDNTATPTAQTLQGASVLSGTTDTAGAALNIAGGQGTGTGVGGDVVFKVAYPSTTGSSANSLSTVATFLASNKASSGTQSLISLTPTVNQSSTAGYTGLLLNVTETATGSGSKNLLDLQAGGVSKLSVSNGGAITSASLTSGGTQCLQASSTGVVSGTGSACGAGGGGLTVGTTAITGGSVGNIFYHAASNLLGEMTTTGSGTVVALATSPTFTTSAISPLFTNTGAMSLTTTASNGNISLTPNGTGSVVITSGVTTGTTTSAALSLAGNSLTTGTGLYAASSTLTSGSLVDLQVSGTAGISSQKVLNVASAGAVTGTQTTYGGYFSNTHTGATAVNVGLYATASGATGANYAAIFDQGNVGIGTTTPSQKLTVQDGVTALTISNYTPNALAGVAYDSTVYTTFISGKYAYVGGSGAGTCSGTTIVGCELSVYDITNPANPVAVGGVDITGDQVNAIRVVGKYAYITLSGELVGTGCNSGDSSGCEFRIYDISNPGTPTFVGGADLAGWANGLDIVGKYVYVSKQANAGTCSGTTVTGCEASIYDISNPANPAPVGGIDISTGIDKIQVVGKYLYLSSQATAGTCSGTTLTGCELRIYNISNPSSPTAVGGFDDGGIGSQAIFVAGNYVFYGSGGVAGTCSGTTLTGCEFKIYDLDDPSSPSPVGGYDTSGIEIRGISVYNKHAYLALASDGGSANEIRILDISTIGTPVVVGGLDLGVTARGLTMGGKYAYVSTSSIAGTCSGTTLTGCEWRIYDMVGIDAPTANIGTLATDYLQVGTNAVVQNLLYVQNALNVGAGGILSGGPVNIQSSTTSASLYALSVQNSAGTSLLAVTDAGGVGIGTTGPGRALEINSATGANLRLTYNDSDGSAANYADLLMSSSGDLTIAPSGSDTAITGNLGITSSNTTQTTTASALALNANSLTSGTGLYAASSTLSSGKLVDLQVSGTAAASNSQTALNILTAGANATSTQSTYGLQVSNTHTGTSATDYGGYFTATGSSATNNIAGYFSASGGTNNYAALFDQGQVGIGVTSSLTGKLHIVGSVTTSGATAVAGTYSNLTLTNSTTSGFQYGDRNINTINGTTAGTEVGTLIRMIDNTACGSGGGGCTGGANTQFVQGLRVESYSGSNVNGTNTAILGFGYTIGLYGETTSQAAADTQPAGVFAYLNNGTDSTTKTRGNAIRAYTNTATSANLVSLYQETSTYTGTGLLINFGNSGGSYSGNFIDAQVAGTSKFTVTSGGVISAGLSGTASTTAICSSLANTTAPTAGVAYEFRDCSGAPAADYAEQYPVDSGIEFGDVVTTGTEVVTTYDQTPEGAIDETKIKGYVTRLKKSTGAYQKNLIGIVVDNYGDFTSSGYNIKKSDNPMPVALSGRVPVKVTSENGVIQSGDYLTSSATVPGKAMKATHPGMILGQALSSPDANGMVMVFVQTSFYDPSISVTTDGNIQLQRGSASTQLVANTTNTAAEVINQQGSGSILQLQQNGMDKFLVNNDGSVNINVTPAGDTDLVLDVKSGTNSLFTINAKGTATFAGVIVIKDDTFAGSITTDETGTAEVTFSYNLGTGKPVVLLTPEAMIPVFAQIGEFKKDDQGNYTGFVIKTFDLISGPVPAIVHFSVIGKQDGYITQGQGLLVQDTPFTNNTPNLIIQNGQVVGSAGDTITSSDFTPISPTDLVTDPTPPPTGSGGTVAGDTTPPLTP